MEKSAHAPPYGALVDLAWCFYKNIGPNGPKNADQDAPPTIFDGIGFGFSRIVFQRAQQKPQQKCYAPRSIGHQEWILSCKTGSATRSNFDFAGTLTEAVLLGSLCTRRGGEKLLWDAAAMKITNVSEANDLIHYKYRDGWAL